MAKQREPQHPKKPQVPNEPPLDDVEDVVEFVDEIAGPADFAFEDEPNAGSPRPPAAKPKESESVLDDELIRLSDSAVLDSEEVSGVISQADLLVSDSTVLPQSEIIRAEPLSESVPIEP